MPEISPLTKNLLKEYKHLKKDGLLQENSHDFIEIDEMNLHVGSFYEKIKDVIDWRGEHLLKRNVIEKVLRKKIFSTTSKKNISPITTESFLIDVMRSGKFNSHRIEKSKADKIQKILDKYNYILTCVSQKSNNQVMIIRRWLYTIAACEIEEVLSDLKKEKIILHYTFQSIKKIIKVEKEIDKKEEELLLYIATQQALFNLDKPIITYHLLKFKYTNWDSFSKKEIEEISTKIIEEKIYIDCLLKTPLLKKFYQFCKKYNTPYLIINDILSTSIKNPEETISNPEEIEKMICKYYDKRVEKMKSELYRTALYSTISIFIINVAALLAFEMPLSRYVNIGEFTSLVIAINILIPTLLMMLMIATVSPPPIKNRKKVLLETMKVLYKSEVKDVYIIKIPKEKKSFIYLFVSFFYAISFLFSMLFIVWLLSLINFPFLSYFVFIFFLSFIAFAGVKIREKFKDLYMIEVKDNFFTIITDIFALPIIQFEKWLITRWEKYNVLSVIFSSFLDMPLKIFLAFLDQWRSYLKEKKEKIY